MVEAEFNLGPITIGLYGIMITLGVIAAITLSFIEAKRQGQATEHLLNMALFVLPLGIIGARLYYIRIVSGIPTARWITGIAIFVSIALMVYRRYLASRKSQDLTGFSSMH